MSVAPIKRRPSRPWFSPVAILRSIWIRPRVYLAIIVGGALLYALPYWMTASMREALAWDGGGLVYLASAIQTMRTCKHDVMQSRAARQDDSRALILFMVLLAIASSFAGIAGLLGDVKSAPKDVRVLYVALAGITIAVSWTVTQFVFALHYAHEFYRPDREDSDSEGGFDFPGCKTPDYWDFLYFSTSIGAASQTSDVSIRSRALRRLVTLHAMVSFVFNTMILALTINLAAGLAG